MNIRSFLRIVSLSAVFSVTVVCASPDWLQWRGPNGNGVAHKSVKPVTEWSESNNIRWKVFVPGRGMSSPIVVNGLVILTTATEDGQFILAYRMQDGGIAWKARAHDGELPEKLHKKNSAASSTPASDGNRIFVLFHNRERLMLTALDLNGEILWQTDTGGFECEYEFGYSASPTVYNDTVIVSSEWEDGYLAAYRVADGSEAWKVARKIPTSYSSPIVAEVAGREQLLLSGSDKVSSFDPKNGKLIWEAPGTCKVTCGTLVWSGDTVFASGGYPNKETVAVRADGSAEVLWKNGEKSYEQSMLYHDGYVYTLNDNGIAICWEAVTGEEKWKERLGGPVSASPILADGKIFAMNEQGITFVFEPNPEEFVKITENTLGQEGFATPVFVGDNILIRTAEPGDDRQEYLYCVGE